MLYMWYIYIWAITNPIIHIKTQKTLQKQCNSQKKTKPYPLSDSTFRTILPDAARCWTKADTQISQAEDPALNPCKYGHLTFYKNAKIYIQ